MKTQKQFSTLAQAKAYIDGLNIPADHIESVQDLSYICLPLYINLKWADCDIIRIEESYTSDFKKVFSVQKRWYSAPALLSEVLGMQPKRYITPDFN